MINKSKAFNIKSISQSEDANVDTRKLYFSLASLDDFMTNQFYVELTF